jgi:hypothetical protein
MTLEKKTSNTRSLKTAFSILISLAKRRGPLWAVARKCPEKYYGKGQNPRK